MDELAKGCIVLSIAFPTCQYCLTWLHNDNIASIEIKGKEEDIFQDTYKVIYKIT